jgi:fructokinase
MVWGFDGSLFEQCGIVGDRPGGTKIEGAIIDPAASNRPTSRLRIPTESEKGYTHVIHQISVLVQQLEDSSGLQRPAAIGIGTPGTTEPSTGLLKNSNSVCLNGKPLRDDLAAALRMDVRLMNDANCFALAESTLGGAQGREVVIGLILGTGVGSGIVVQGRVLGGLHGIAGEWGHNPMCGESEPCYCGREGCVETVISGPALERWYRERSGESAPLREISSRATEGDVIAQETIRRLSDKFGEAIAAVINVLDPDAIIPGGGVGRVDVLYEPSTRAAIERHLFNPELRTEILRPTLGDSAGVFGAALLARDSL